MKRGNAHEGDALKNILADYPIYFNAAPEQKEKKICLNMIVKDETAIIEKCINSVVDEIDCYVICDTGSSDVPPPTYRKTTAGPQL